MRFLCARLRARARAERATRSNSSGDGKQDARCAQVFDHRQDDRVAAIRADRFVQRHREEGACVGPPGESDIQTGLQIDEMFASCLSTTGVVAKIVHAGMNLTSDESQHVFGRFLVDPHDPARMAKVCELNSKPEPVGGAPALADQRHIVGRERVVTNDRGRIGRRIEQRRARLW